MRSVFLLGLLAGCRGVLGIEDGTLTDASPSDDAAITPDARLCVGSFARVCFDAPPQPELIFESAKILSSVTECTHTLMVAGQMTCVIAAQNITVGPLAVLATIGTLPIALVATDTLQVDGLLDGWNAGPAPACMTNLATAGAGGAGGSFVERGGTGGRRGNSGSLTSPGPALVLQTLTRGCPGGNAGDVGGELIEGGNGGGSILLVANTLAIGGTLNVSGAGGDGGRASTEGIGGGGGGSGGIIALDAATFAISEKAVFLALGGGGGEGGSTAAGADGARADALSLMGLGGRGNSNSGGDGGNGAVQGLPTNGQTGGASTAGGGGGGGGIGLILITANASLGNSTALPAAITL